MFATRLMPRGSGRRQSRSRAQRANRSYRLDQPARSRGCAHEGLQCHLHALDPEPDPPDNGEQVDPDRELDDRGLATLLLVVGCGRGRLWATLRTNRRSSSTLGLPTHDDDRTEP